MTDIAIVILNWNGRNYLEQFLPSVVKYSSGCCLVVADNASTDDSLLFLRQHYPQVEIIVNLSNEGFSKGYNDALKQVQAKYYVLLNSDVEVTEGWIEPVIALMEQDSRIAACQPKIKSYNAKNKFEYAGAAGGFIDIYGYPFCRGRIFDTLETDQGQYNDNREIFWATGACMFVRADLYWQAGGLDNDFFAHMEEIDLCWRLKNMGYKIYYCGQSEVYHVGGGTLNRTNPKKTYLNFRNGLTLMYKNLPRQEVLPKIFIRLLLDGVAGLRFAVVNPFDTLAIVKAHWHFFYNIRKHGRKRKALTAYAKRHKGMYQGSIIKSYFFDKKKYFNELGNL
jgi:GT2 family glycosyltransferase